MSKNRLIDSPPQNKQVVYIRRVEEKPAVPKKENPAEHKVKRRIPTFFGWIKIFFFLGLALLLLRRFDGRGRNDFHQNPPAGPNQENQPRFRSLIDDVNLDGQTAESLAAIRIGYWNLSPLTLTQAADHSIGERIAVLIAENDLTAVTGVRMTHPAIVDVLLSRLKQCQNGEFAALVSPVNSDGESALFVYRTDRLAVDTQRTLLLREEAPSSLPPIFAAAFAAKIRDLNKRFTFTAVVFRTADNTADSKNSAHSRPADIFRTAARCAGRAGIPEDDLILLATLTPDGLDSLRSIPNLAAVNDRIATDSNGTVSDYIIFDMKKTTEYIERFGVISLPQRFGISLQEAKKIARHWPVRADFSVREIPSER